MERLGEVIFFKGISNPTLAEEVLEVINEYLPRNPSFSHINFARFGDRELDDMFPDFEQIADRTVIFFECLKDEETVFRFLSLCWAAKHQYSARRIVAVLSFVHFRRQDHPENIAEINRSLWLAAMMKASGVDHVILVTPHSSQIGINFEQVGITFKAVDASNVFVNALLPLLPAHNRAERVKVLTPDEGSISRAIALARKLEIGVFFSLQNRGFSNEKVLLDADREQIESIKAKYPHFTDLEYATSENVRGMTLIIVEDELDTGGTANKRGVMLKEYGAGKIYLCVTHPVCSNGWKRKLFSGNPFDQVIMGNTIFRGVEKRTGGFINDVSMAGPLATELFQLLEQELS